MEDLRNRFFYFIEKAGVSFYGRYLRHRRFNRQFDYFLELMSRNRPVEEIYSWQEYQFKNIWPYIRENEFYKQRVKHLNGLTGPLLRSPQWEMIPIIDKGTMRKHFAEIANIQKSKGFIKKHKWHHWRKI